jgi:nicotinamidase-related amidase
MTSPDPYTAPHWDRAALLTIDVQVDTLDGGSIEVPGTSTVVPAIARAAAAARRAGRPIVHVVRLYLPDGSNVDACRRVRVESGWHPLAPGTPGSELAPLILPSPCPRLDPELLMAGRPQRLGEREVAVYKPRWGAFYRTPLDEHLRELGVDTLVVAGCNFPNCPRTSIYAASERDYRVVALTDAISGIDARGVEELVAIGVTPCTVEGLGW